LAPPTRPRAWTRPDDYVVALARRRTERRKREPKPRTTPEAPRLLLSTIPFVALLVALAVIAVGLFAAAWPSSQPQPKPEVAAHERGTAEKGWFQEAEKEFH
jgi:hypothetical protein